MKEGRWVVRKIVSGAVVERSKIWLPARVKTRKGRIKGSSPASKRDANANQAVKQLARVLNCNFSQRDLYLTLSYSEESLPADWQEQERDCANFLRRVNYCLRKQGIDRAKWVSVCSCADGKTGEVARAHIHIAMSGDGIRFEAGKWLIGNKSLEAIWGKGQIYAEPLRGQKDYTPLAVYLIRQAGREENRKKYHTARGMEQPVITEEEVKTGRPLRAPAGAKITEQKYNQLEEINYIRYIKPQRSEKNGVMRNERLSGENGQIQAAGRNL